MSGDPSLRPNSINVKRSLMSLNPEKRNAVAVMIMLVRAVYYIVSAQRIDSHIVTAGTPTTTATALI